MGCGNSAPVVLDPESAERKAKAQRRKLSLAPQHEGGGGGGYSNKANGGNSNRKASMFIEGIGELDANDEKAKNDNVKQVVAKCNKGYVPFSNKKVNQDRPVVKFNLGDEHDLSLFGVMDGHGEFGHNVSEFVMNNLPVTLGKQAKLLIDEDTKQTEEGILKGTAECVDMLKQTSINCAFSGTTCVFGVLKKKTLYVANIGDSRAVLCRQNGSAIQSIDLSEDQKPESPGEKERIIAAGGRVEPLPGPPDEDCGPDRVWLKEVDVPGLAMSRSIGDDVSQTVGVISVPVITTHQIEPNDIFAVWASDGVWEFISSSEAMQIVWRYKDNLNKAVDELTAEAKKRWQAEEEVIDDITAVIVQFNDFK